MTALIAGVSFVVGAVFVGAILAREMRRQARFLEKREVRGRERAISRIPLGPPRRLARAINTFIEGARNESESARLRSDKLMRDLSDLSHDIRTPLAAAKGHLQLFGAPAKSIAPYDCAAPIEHLNAAMARIDATTAILDQLLELARASDPDREYRCEPVLLLSALLDVLEGHELELGALGWEPTVVFAEEDVYVEADARALERILENLITNAIRYGVPPFSCVQSSAGDEVVLVVSNGVEEGGVPDPSALFERFYRVDRSRTGAGTGLGLPIAKALSERMGMRLSADMCDSLLSVSLVMKKSGTWPREDASAPRPLAMRPHL